uniref:Endonuclease/exonuclease/phosphatase domain-containing protein n=1 Tax=Sparus aurata TaxID=8175 RepID=A0A671V1H2_SPAAU
MEREIFPWIGASRGTSILISKKKSFHYTDVIANNSSRYIIVSGIPQHRKITLINIYAPNSGQLVGDPILLGGDMNLVNNPLLDRSSRPLPADAALSTALDELQRLLRVTDVW